MKATVRRIDECIAFVEKMVIVAGLSAMVAIYFTAVVYRYRVSVGTPLLVGGGIIFLAGLFLAIRGGRSHSKVSLLKSRPFTLAILGVIGAGLGALGKWYTGGLPWADEVCRFLLLWVGFSGASLATREGKHLSIDVADKVLKGPARHKVGALAMVIAAAFALAASWFCFGYVGHNFELGRESLALRLPLWIPLLILPISFAIISGRFLGLAVARYHGLEVKQDEATAAIAAGEELQEDAGDPS